uniref:zinc finger MYM-type protein 1-like n=1 Tax=Fragaria vesca subsp. vesca TaxID=101020 RepID=UPI0005CB341D|nr:PREDICTED: zinc finger MYM-type protein 1-like [Fragaria vesca subsp. vesca]
MSDDSDPKRLSKKAKTLDSWLKKIREDQNNSAPLTSSEHQHVPSPILEPRESVPSAPASNTDSSHSTIIDEHHPVISPISEPREFVPSVDPTPRDSIPTPPCSNIDSALLNEQPPVTSQTHEDIDFVIGDLERDPGKRVQIYEYPVNQQDHVRRSYIKLGPYQPKLFEYPRVRYELTNKVEILKNRLRLKTTIESVRYLAYQGCAFRGHDESVDSRNRGNCVELIKHTAKFSPEVAKVVLENAPKNATYISPRIQKQVLNILANKVRKHIRDEVGDSSFCILVDEAQDSSHKEQMAIILRFVDTEGFLRERFFDIVTVEDTTAGTLHQEISKVLLHHNLQVERMRGQEYDGASNMRGQWNGLQALFMKDCSYAYYVHCFAHQLQLTLVSASKKIDPIWEFFSSLSTIVNVICASPKRLSEFHVAQVTHICDLIDKYDATCTVLEFIMDDKSTESLSAGASGAYNAKSQDILNAMNLVEVTVHSLQNLREHGWEDFLEKVESFCKQHDIDIPAMDCQYSASRRRRYCQQRSITTEHHYRVDVFYAAIDFQLVELNGRFSERAKELLILSSSLDPADGFKAFNIDNICTLADKFYPQDFTRQELHSLRSELIIYESDVPHDDVLKTVTTLSELCREIFETTRSQRYQMIDRLIRLVLTLPVSTATIERAFSAMKRIKTILRNKMENDFLADNMIVHIEKELAENYDADSIIKDFASMQDRRVQFE